MKITSNLVGVAATKSIASLPFSAIEVCNPFLLSIVDNIFLFEGVSELEGVKQ